MKEISKYVEKKCCEENEKESARRTVREGGPGRCFVARDVLRVRLRDRRRVAWSVDLDKNVDPALSSSATSKSLIDRARRREEEKEKTLTSAAYDTMSLTSLGV